MEWLVRDDQEHPRAKTAGIEQRSISSTGGDPFSLGCAFRGKLQPVALVDERNGQEQDSQDHEADDAVLAIQLGDVVNEHFHGGGGDEQQGLPADEGALPQESNDHQHGAIGHPESGIGEVALYIILAKVDVSDPSLIEYCRANGRDLAAKIIGHLAGQPDQGKGVERDNCDCGNGARSFVFALGGVPGHGSQHGDCDGIGRHAHIKDQLRCLEIVDQQQAAHSQDKGSQRKNIQEIRADAITYPEQNPGLNKPANSDPVRIESNGNRNRDEPDGYREVEKIQDLCGAGVEISDVYLPAEEDINRGQAQREPRHVGLVDLLNHGVGLEEIDPGIYKCQNGRDRGQQRDFAFGLKRKQGRHRENGEEQCGEGERKAELAAVIKTYVPSDIEKQRACITHDEQAAPRLEGHEDQGRKIENGNVGEENDFVILASRKQEWGGESSGERESSEDLRVLRQSHDRCGGGHNHHHGEGDAARNQAVDVERGPQREIERSDADGFERVGERLVAVPAEALAPDHDRDAGENSYGHAPGRADPVIVEGELQEVGDSDQECSDANAVQPV